MLLDIDFDQPQPCGVQSVDPPPPSDFRGHCRGPAFGGLHPDLPNRGPRFVGNVDLDQFKFRTFFDDDLNKGAKAMSMQTAVMLFAIVIPFAIFAGVLGWAQSRTE